MGAFETVAKGTPLEIWGGAECSYVRIHDRHSDQFASSGHDHRLEDLERFASLGLRALRYPISWERMAAGRIDWRWAERRLERLRELGIKPIVGFLHHGSGPLPDGLLAADFAPRLAEFAHEVARRFPWVDAYTPVNEPGTTARFSGLYGVWYPHRQDDTAFVRCLLNQIEGTRQAMAAVRAVNSQAQLIQTEDLGKTHSTATLEYQADFENERRWLSLDLLSGRVDEQHPLAGYLQKAGMREDEFARLLDTPCPPDILGMNYYITSERFLDDRLHHYPGTEHGGNGRHRYADVPAVRVRREGAIGPAALLREVWDRYRLPIAITEVQLACTREEQLRWLRDAWQQANAARDAGVDVRAITPWALLGAYEWDSLLTQVRGSYESGAFDLRAPQPRPTAVARAIKTLATQGVFDHPVLDAPGWWARPDRLAYPTYSSPRTGAAWAPASSAVFAQGKPLLIVGASGRIGQVVAAACSNRALRAVMVNQGDSDFARTEIAQHLLQEYRPWAVIDCSGFASIEAAEFDPAAFHYNNVMPATTLAGACADADLPFLTFSSDQVFDGEAARPYVESDAPNPLNAYGRGELEKEQRILAFGGRALIARVGPLFGQGGDEDFVALALRKLAAGQPLNALTEQVVSPTFAPELVTAALDLLIDGEQGIWHLANSGQVSWFDWACEIARRTGYSLDSVRPVAPRAAGEMPHPRLCALQSKRGQLLGPWQITLAQHLARSDSTGANLAA